MVVSRPWEAGDDMGEAPVNHAQVHTETADILDGFDQGSYVTNDPTLGTFVVYWKAQAGHVTWFLTLGSQGGSDLVVPSPGPGYNGMGSGFVAGYTQEPGQPRIPIEYFSGFGTTISVTIPATTFSANTRIYGMYTGTA